MKSSALYSRAATLLFAVLVPCSFVNAQPGGRGEGELIAEWSALPDLPSGISNNAVAAVRNDDGTITFYSFMGIVIPTNLTSVTSAAFRLRWPGGEWEPIANAPLLNGRGKIGANAVTVASEVYLIGGYTIGGPEVTEPRLFRYDASKNDYVQLANVPVEVDDTVVGVYLDRYIYLVSGWHGPVNENVTNVQIYDTQLDQWMQASPIMGPFTGLFGHAGGLVGDKIFYMDGADSVGAFNIQNQFFVGQIDPFKTGDISMIDWVELPAHPGEPTYRAAPSTGAALGDGWLLAGGTNNPYNFTGNGYNGVPSMPLDQVLHYSVQDNSWLIVPTSGEHEPTMDHRGLVGCGSCWVTIGGMVAPGQTTEKVYLLEFENSEEPCFYLLGDINRDQLVDLLDIAPFVELLTDGDFQIEADINGDQSVTLLDICPFVELLLDE